MEILTLSGGPSPQLLVFDEEALEVMWAHQMQFVGKNMVD